MNVEMMGGITVARRETVVAEGTVTNEWVFSRKGPFSPSDGFIHPRQTRMQILGLNYVVPSLKCTAATGGP